VKDVCGLFALDNLILIFSLQCKTKIGKLKRNTDVIAVYFSASKCSLGVLCDCETQFCLHVCVPCFFVCVPKG
jgi:hypothetical protein